MKKKYPRTKEECFAMLDEEFSSADKKIIINPEERGALHWTLGLWIRNNWLYSMPIEVARTLIASLREEKNSTEEDEFSSFMLIGTPDELSGEIIDRYIEYLRNQNNSNKKP